MVIWLLRRSASTCLRSYWPFASAPPILIHTGAHFLTSATISGSRVATFWMWCTSRRRNYIHFTAGEPPLHERVSDRHTRQEARGDEDLGLHPRDPDPDSGRPHPPSPEETGRLWRPVHRDHLRDGLPISAISRVAPGS